MHITSKNFAHNLDFFPHNSGGTNKCNVATYTKNIKQDTVHKLLVNALEIVEIIKDLRVIFFQIDYNPRNILTLKLKSGSVAR
jgi:hypothetical protein